MEETRTEPDWLDAVVEGVIDGIVVPVALTPEQRARFEAAAARGHANLGWSLAARRQDEADAAHAEVGRILGLLRAVTVAADRLLQGWAEGDDGRKADLWRGLAAATTSAADDVYPLPASGGGEG